MLFRAYFLFLEMRSAAHQHDEARDKGLEDGGLLDASYGFLALFVPRFPLESYPRISDRFRQLLDNDRSGSLESCIEVVNATKVEALGHSFQLQYIFSSCSPAHQRVNVSQLF